MHKGVFSEVDTYRAGKLETAYRWPDGIVAGTPVSPALASAPSVLAFNVADPYHADNVAVARGTELQKITHEGDDTLANVNLGEAKVVQWTAKDGTKLEGIVTFPLDYAAGKKYPFLVLPHGGPEANDEFRLDLILALDLRHGIRRAAAGISRLNGLRRGFPRGHLSAFRRSRL